MNIACSHCCPSVKILTSGLSQELSHVLDFSQVCWGGEIAKDRHNLNIKILTVICNYFIWTRFILTTDMICLKKSDLEKKHEGSKKSLTCEAWGVTESPYRGCTANAVVSHVVMVSGATTYFSRVPLDL